MAFQKGQSGNPAGRKPGTQNRLTLTVKQGFEAAFEKMQGGEHALDKWAAKNPTDFYKLASKLIPSQITAELSGIDGGPIEIDQTTRSARLAGVVARLKARQNQPGDAPDDGSDLA